MVQEASLDTLALAGAIAATLFAALTYMLGRRSRAAPALVWWATAFGVEAWDRSPRLTSFQGGKG